MNGGRLSNDEAFLIGVEELQQQLSTDQPDAAAAERALTRIAVRYPEEADQLREVWPHNAAQCHQLLTAVLAQHAAESED